MRPLRLSTQPSASQRRPPSPPCADRRPGCGRGLARGVQPAVGDPAVALPGRERQAAAVEAHRDDLAAGVDQQVRAAGRAGSRPARARRRSARAGARGCARGRARGRRARSRPGPRAAAAPPASAAPGQAGDRAATASISSIPWPISTKQGSPSPSGISSRPSSPSGMIQNGGQRHRDQIGDDAVGRQAAEMVDRERRGRGARDQRGQRDAADVEQRGASPGRRRRPGAGRRRSRRPRSARPRRRTTSGTRRRAGSRAAAAARPVAAQATRRIENGLRSTMTASSISAVMMKARWVGTVAPLRSADSRRRRRSASAAATFLVGRRRASGGASASAIRATKNRVPATRPRCRPEIASRWAMPAIAHCRARSDPASAPRRPVSSATAIAPAAPGTALATSRSRSSGAGAARPTAPAARPGAARSARGWPSA